MHAAVGSDVAFRRELVGDVGTSAHRVAKDELDRTALRAVQPDGAQRGAGGAQVCTEDRLCSQLPVTVLGMFSWLQRVPQAGVAPEDTEFRCCHQQNPSGPVRGRYQRKT